MSQIKAVYFDFGGVIGRTEDRGPRTELGARLGLTYDEIGQLVFSGPVGPLDSRDDQGGSSGWRATLGLISEDEHWSNLIRSLGLKEGDVQSVRDAFFAGDRIDWNVVDFLRRLRKDSHRTGLISNAWTGLRPWLVQQGIDDAFDEMIISAEIALAKPAAEIYQYALNQLGVEPHEAVFVDDMIENVDASRALGMHGIQFHSAEQALAEVKRLLTDGPN